MAVCPHTGQEFTTQLHVDDLKIVTRKLGFDFSQQDGGSHLDLSPEGKTFKNSSSTFKSSSRRRQFIWLKNILWQNYLYP